MVFLCDAFRQFCRLQLARFLRKVRVADYIFTADQSVRRNIRVRFAVVDRIGRESHILHTVRCNGQRHDAFRRQIIHTNAAALVRLYCAALHQHVFKSQHRRARAGRKSAFNKFIFLQPKCKLIKKPAFRTIAEQKHLVLFTGVDARLVVHQQACPVLAHLLAHVQREKLAVDRLILPHLHK